MSSRHDFSPLPHHLVPRRDRMRLDDISKIDVLFPRSSDLERTLKDERFHSSYYKGKGTLLEVLNGARDLKRYVSSSVCEFGYRSNRPWMFSPTWSGEESTACMHLAPLVFSRTFGPSTVELSTSMWERRRMKALVYRAVRCMKYSKGKGWRSSTVRSSPT